MKQIKYSSKDEKIKRGFKIFAIVFAVAVVLAIVIGVVASTVTENKRKDLLDLTDNMIGLYKNEPWGGGAQMPDYSDNVWEYYRMIMLADRGAVYDGYDGYQFEGNTVCVDLSNVPEADREAVKEMMTDYLTLRGKAYRFNSKEELDELGLIDHGNRESYTEGCILTFSKLNEQPEGFIEADIEVYYSQMSFNVLNIGIFSEEVWQEYAVERFDDQTVEQIGKDSVVYKRALLDGSTEDTFVLTAAEKKMYCISTMTG